MEKKYIIKLEDDELAYQTIIINGMPYIKPLRLLPYIEPEDYPKQAYTDTLRMDVYRKGLSDAWEAARKIGSNSMCSLKEMGFDFSRCVVADYNPSWFVVKNYSASECIEKIRQYEQEKDKQARIEYNYEEIEDVINTTIRECNVSLDEIAEVLRKMKEVNNG